MKFTNNVVMLGCGSVAQCTIPLLFKFLEISSKQLTVIDLTDNSDKIPEGIRYIVQEITAENHAELFSRYLKKGDIAIDLGWNVGTIDLLKWCKDHDVICINTAIEIWAPFKNASLEQRTLYYRNMLIREATKGWKNTPTAILDHGANPGLISSFAKQGLIDIANEVLKRDIERDKKRDLEAALKQQNFAKIAYLIGLKSIHISERDTQKTAAHRQQGEFVNTWSVVGFYEEGIAPSELGWGTHEKSLPHDGHTHSQGPQNQIYLSSRGIDTWVDSWVPNGPIKGMVVRHGESFTLSEFLTYKEKGKVVYRPTVHYAYQPCEEALQSLEELRENDYKLQKRQRILAEEITGGYDGLGCLFLGHDLGAWWTGTILDIEESRRLVPHQNATTVQVAIGVIAAILYSLKHPREGVCQPEHLPHDFVLELAKPYLGECLSIPTSWRPPKQRQRPDSWQFSTFLCEAPFGAFSLPK